MIARDQQLVLKYGWIQLDEAFVIITSPMACADPAARESVAHSASAKRLVLDMMWLLGLSSAGGCRWMDPMWAGARAKSFRNYGEFPREGFGRVSRDTLTESS